MSLRGQACDIAIFVLRLKEIRCPAQYGMTGDPRKVITPSYDQASRLTQLRMSTIENKFQGLTKEEILLHREVFLSAEGGLRLADFCEIEDLAVIGIEGGTYNGSFTPDLDLIQDYSEPAVTDWPRFR